MTEYERKFSELVHFVPFIAENEEQKMNKFTAGLSLRVKTYVTLGVHTRYGELVEAATKAERSAETFPKPKQQFSQKRSWTGSQQGGSNKMAKSEQKPLRFDSRRQS